ncbi:MAG TPA: MFS transporter [Solirubrobacteraceae bacterium]
MSARLADPARTRSKAGRRRIVLLLGGVLALESADLSTIGAVGPELESALGITHAQLGLLAAAGTLTAALFTLPVGVLADRVTRTPLLAGSVGLWAVAMFVSGTAGSFTMLLLSRVALGAVTATAGPTLLSLVGDYFEPRERARHYSSILGGELLGSGFGFLVSGNLAGLLSWRWAFWVLVPPAVALAVALHRHLPEPRRGTGSEQDMSLLAALRYVLSVRTNLMLIAAAVTGNFFFAGVRTFTVVFIHGHYRVPEALATTLMGVLGAGALAGVLAGGRVADALARRGHRTARVTVAGAATIAAAVLWTVPLVVTSLAVGLAVGLLAAAAMSMPNAPIDAARLDVVPPRLWGRAESVRALLRALAFAAAPLVFGFAADRLGHGHGSGTQLAFLLMLVPLALSGLVLLAARRTYPRDSRGQEVDRVGLSDERPG